MTINYRSMRFQPYQSQKIVWSPLKTFQVTDMKT